VQEEMSLSKELQGEKDGVTAVGENTKHTATLCSTCGVSLLGNYDYWN
jgi:hypothetical protein